MNKKLERFGPFLAYKTDSEKKNFAIFDNAYSTDMGIWGYFLVLSKKDEPVKCVKAFGKSVVILKVISSYSIIL